MNRTEKQTAVEGLGQDFAAHPVVFALDFRGLKVDEATELRRKIRASGARYRVIKNTLALRALEGTSIAPLGAQFQGMTGLAYTDADPVALAKVLNDFSLWSTTISLLVSRRMIVVLLPCSISIRSSPIHVVCC